MDDSWVRKRLNAGLVRRHRLHPNACPKHVFPEQNERLDEENRVRLKEESRQARLREKRREEAKNNIILQVGCRLQHRKPAKKEKY